MRLLHHFLFKPVSALLPVFIPLVLLLCNSNFALYGQNPVKEFRERSSMPQKELWEKSYDHIDKMLALGAKMKPIDPDSAMSIFYTVYKESEAIQFPDGMATSLLWMGGIFLDKGQPSKAISYFRKAQPYCESAVNTKAALMVLWNTDMATAYSVLRRYDSAMNYYFNALNLTLPETKEKQNEVLLYNNISSAYRNMQQDDKALPFLKKAAQIALEKGYNKELINAYQSLSMIYLNKGKLDTAEAYLKKSERLNEEKKIGYGGQLHYARAFIYYKRNEPILALAEFDSARQLKNNKPQDKVNGLIGMAACYFLMKDYKNAKLYFMDALAQNENAEISKQSLVEIYTNLSEIYDSLRDYPKAYHYQVLAFQERDTLNKMVGNKTIQDLESLNRLARNDKELTDKKMQLLLSAGALRKKNLWIGSIIALALIVVTIVIILYQKQRLKMQKIITAQQQQKVEVLKAVIEGEEKERGRIGRELHDDIMVQLSIVKMGLEILPMNYPDIKHTDDYKNITQQMNFVGQKIRQTAHNLMPDALLEQGLISAIHYFCKNVEKMTGIRIHVQHYGTIPRLTSDIEISVFRITQELIQNIIKHAKAKNALVQLNYRDDQLTITVEDDGTGFPEATEEQVRKSGLVSIRNRIKAMNGSLDIHRCIPHGASVNVEFMIYPTEEKSQKNNDNGNDTHSHN